MARRAINLLLILLVVVSAVASTSAGGSTALFVSHPFGYGRPTAVKQQSTLLQSTVEERYDAADAHLFLRFSPLIGGPSFLPLHVEVLFAIEDEVDNKKIQQRMDTIHIRNDNNLSSEPIAKGAAQLHRFDFLPENPTDPATLTQLLTLRAVPGRVRYRSYDRISEESTSNNDTNNNQDGRGITILVPLATLPYMGNENSSIQLAKNFKDEFSDTMYKDLRLLWGKNCLSFALDLISHIESTNTSYQRMTTWNKLEIQ